MKFGDAEWFAKVEENYQFPVILAMYISSKKGSFNSMIVDSKSLKIADIKYSKFSPDVVLDNGEHLALLGVKRVLSVKDYYEWAKEFHEHWDKEVTQ